jgi:uncharacterized membrane protein
MSATDIRLRRAMIALAAVGLGIAGYLTYVHYEGIKVLCVANGGCEQVQASAYAKLAGVPVAALGLVGYTLILGSLLVRFPAAEIVTLAAAAGGFMFSAYLTYRELFSIHAICQWCVGSAAIMTCLLVLAAVRYLRGPPSASVVSC